MFCERKHDSSRNFLFGKSVHNALCWKHYEKYDNFLARLDSASLNTAWPVQVRVRIPPPLNTTIIYICVAQPYRRGTYLLIDLFFGHIYMVKAINFEFGW